MLEDETKEMLAESKPRRDGVSRITAAAIVKRERKRDHVVNEQIALIQPHKSTHIQIGN